MKRIKLCFCVAAVAVAAYGQDFEYDANGNLTKDRRKGLSFAYNRLNLLEKVWVEMSSASLHELYVSVFDTLLDRPVRQLSLSCIWIVLRKAGLMWVTNL